MATEAVLKKSHSLIVLSLALGMSGTTAEAGVPARAHEAATEIPEHSAGGPQEGAHTVVWWCVDLNDLWNLDVPVIMGVQFFTPPSPSPLPACSTTSTFPITVPAGSGWVPMGAAFWITHTHYTPEMTAALAAIGYEFVSNNPIEDLRRKVTAIRYVVRTFPGNDVVTERTFDPQQNFQLIRWRQYEGDLGVFAIENPPLGIHLPEQLAGQLPFITFPAVGDPLPPGEYRVQVFWVLSALHNDGLGMDAGNFFAAGELLRAQPRFTVVP